MIKFIVITFFMCRVCLPSLPSYAAPGCAVRSGDSKASTRQNGTRPSLALRVPTLSTASNQTGHDLALYIKIYIKNSEHAEIGSQAFVK